MNPIALLKQWLSNLGLNEASSSALSLIIGVFVLILLSYLVDLFTRKLLLRGVQRIVEKSRNKWDDVLLEKRVFHRLAHIAPLLIFELLSPLIFARFPDILPMVMRFLNILVVIFSFSVLSALLSVGEYFMKKAPLFREKPIDSYFQLSRIVLGIIGGLLILSFALDKSPSFFLSAFGAMTAVILLVFKDTILGFVASIYISANDMVRVGDWVEMPKYGADGDVLQMTLTTIKIQNFDKTITTIPTYAFLADSFKNWRGMKAAKGRRIKRSITLKMSSICFCTAEMLDKYKEIPLMETVLAEVSPKGKVVNPMTNAGLFRKYLEQYLRTHPMIHQRMGMTLMVRHLQPTDKGLPLELYAFSVETNWVAYENLQADILDHAIAMASSFDLELFQYPTSKDFIQIQA